MKFNSGDIDDWLKLAIKISILIIITLLIAC